MGVRTLIVPEPNGAEGALVEGLRVLGARTLVEAVELFADPGSGKPCAPTPPAPPSSTGDLADVRGQDAAKWALEVAAAGGHNALFIGPPGAGKTMLARRLPGLLPALSFEEAVEATSIWSVAGRLKPGRGLLPCRPFRAPHHTISVAGLIGGGTPLRPGEISLAHHGVLFMDELPEFGRAALEALRQPLEDGEVSLVRAKDRANIPARFMLIGAMNPCPCGHAADADPGRCGCTDAAKDAYGRRVSGPILDRFDLHIEVGALRTEDFLGQPRGESSADVRERVERARAVQRRRYARVPGLHCNGQLSGLFRSGNAGGSSARARRPDRPEAPLGACARPHPQARAHHRRLQRRRAGHGEARPGGRAASLPRPGGRGQTPAVPAAAPGRTAGRAASRSGRFARRASQGGDMSKVSEKLKAIFAAIGAIEKQYGKGAVMRLGAGEAAQPVAIIPSGSLGLDLALGCGGYPRGRVVEIFGPESSGKTTLTLHAIAQVQAQGGCAAFIDAEHALDVTYARKLGVKVEDLLISQPDTGEQALEITETLVRSGAVDLVVIDSVAALVPKAEIEGEMGDSHMGLQARLMSQALRKLTAVVSRNSATVFFINQIRMKIGVVFGSPETTTGGNALKFYSSVRLDIRRIGAVKDGDQMIGNRTRVKVVKNKLAPPFREAEFDILIEKSGAWFEIGGERIGPGREKAVEALRGNPAVAEGLEQKVREAGVDEKKLPTVTQAEAAA